LSLTAAVAVVIMMAVLGEYTKTRGRMLLTALVLAAYFFVTLGPITLAKNRMVPAMAWLAYLFGGAALVLILTGIWGTPNSDAFWKSTAIVTALGLGLAYFAVVDYVQGGVTRNHGNVTLAVALALVAVGIAAGINWPPYWWVFTVFVIWWLAAVFIPPVLLLARRVQGRWSRTNAST
tara:strand:- start:1696 stop:2229 length:534 start_codon:yes stop_codon:yes gene_type:complete